MCIGDFFSQSGDTRLGSPIGRTLGQYLPHSQSLEGGQAGGFIEQGEPPGWECRLQTSVFLSATLPCFVNLSGKLSKLAFETFALRMKSPLFWDIYGCGFPVWSANDWRKHEEKATQLNSVFLSPAACYSATVSTALIDGKITNPRKTEILAKYNLLPNPISFDSHNLSSFVWLVFLPVLLWLIEFLGLLLDVYCTSFDDRWWWYIYNGEVSVCQQKSLFPF